MKNNQYDLLFNKEIELINKQKEIETNTETIMFYDGNPFFDFIRPNVNPKINLHKFINISLLVIISITLLSVLNFYSTAPFLLIFFILFLISSFCFLFSTSVIDFFIINSEPSSSDSIDHLKKYSEIEKTRIKSLYIPAVVFSTTSGFILLPFLYIIFKKIHNKITFLPVKNNIYFNEKIEENNRMLIKIKKERLCNYNLIMQNENIFHELKNNQKYKQVAENYKKEIVKLGNFEILDYAFENVNTLNILNE